MSDGIENLRERVSKAEKALENSAPKSVDENLARYIKLKERLNKKRRGLPPPFLFNDIGFANDIVTSFQ